MAVNQAIKKHFVKLGLAASLTLAGAYLVGPWEGMEKKAYQDVVGVWTVCYGQTQGVKRGDVYTTQQCNDQLAKSLPRYQEQMLRYVKVPLTPYQEAAFISFTYNVGVDSFAKSTLLKKLNQGNYQGACEELRKWVYAGGKKYQGLVNRREDEYKMCIGAYKDETVGMLRNWETQYDFTTEIITSQKTTEEVHQVF